MEAEERYRFEPADGQTPESIFERRWAEAVLEGALARLRQEFEVARRGPTFDDLKPFLLNADEGASYPELASRLGISETGARSAVHRLRRRFRDLMRAEIAETVGSPAEVEEEIRHLFRALAE